MSRGTYSVYTCIYSLYIYRIDGAFCTYLQNNIANIPHRYMHIDGDLRDQYIEPLKYIRQKQAPRPPHTSSLPALCARGTAVSEEERLSPVLSQENRIWMDCGCFRINPMNHMRFKRDRIGIPLSGSMTITTGHVSMSALPGLPFLCFGRRRTETLVHNWDGGKQYESYSEFRGIPQVDPCLHL